VLTGGHKTGLAICHLACSDGSVRKRLRMPVATRIHVRRFWGTRDATGRILAIFTRQSEAPGVSGMVFPLNGSPELMRTKNDVLWGEVHRLSQSDNGLW